MIVRHVVPLSGPRGGLLYYGTAWSRMRWWPNAGRWARAWYETHGEAVADTACRGVPREDMIDAPNGDGPQERR